MPLAVVCTRTLPELASSSKENTGTDEKHPPAEIAGQSLTDNASKAASCQEVAEVKSPSKETVENSACTSLLTLRSSGCSSAARRREGERFRPSSLPGSPSTAIEEAAEGIFLDSNSMIKTGSGVWGDTGRNTEELLAVCMPPESGEDAGRLTSGSGAGCLAMDEADGSCRALHGDEPSSGVAQIGSGIRSGTADQSLVVTLPAASKQGQTEELRVLEEDDLFDEEIAERESSIRRLKRSLVGPTDDDDDDDGDGDDGDAQLEVSDADFEDGKQQKSSSVKVAALCFPDCSLFEKHVPVGAHIGLCYR